jgi:transglutaminase-like putative cysteine protease
MRVRLEEGDRNKIKNFRWRGVALDSFDNQTWKKSRYQFSEPFIKSEKDFFLIDSATDVRQVVTQTVYLEPLDTPVLFSLLRPVAIQGNFQLITRDSEGSITFSHSGAERTTYKVFSDTSLPNIERLRMDNSPYSVSAQRYLKLPEKIDERISNLASEVIQSSGTKNRYDQAKAIEKHLQTTYGYTLELKSGGTEPLADFLFNVRQGHCEYFATAMAVMLRTQGIATRIVNGFQQGEYNEAADAYIVRQKDAHSWVEVYFPKENAWIPFDPTAPAGQFPEETGSTGITGKFDKMLDALETYWIQYVVTYDNQEQRSLFRSVKKGVNDYQGDLSVWANQLKNAFTDWLKDVRGDKGFEASAKAIGLGVGYILLGMIGIGFLTLVIRKVLRLDLWERLCAWFKSNKETSIVEFYERMQKVLEKQGFKRVEHQTPLEFAFALNMPEAVNITEKYNRVRFGEKNLSKDEIQEIENWLDNLEKKQR